MKVMIDRDRCEGHGQCAAVAPTLFYLDDDGFAAYRYDGETVPGGYEEAAGHAVAACPIVALHQR